MDELGTEGFLLKEECVLGVTCVHIVRATGGSVALEERVMAHLKRNGLVFYLSLPCEEIVHRLRNIATRGIAMGPGESLRMLYDHRVPHYLWRTDVVIDAWDQTLEETVQAVVTSRNALKDKA